MWTDGDPGIYLETIGQEKSLLCEEIAGRPSSPLFPQLFSDFDRSTETRTGRQPSSSSSSRNLLVIAFSTLPSVLSPTIFPLNISFFLSLSPPIEREKPVSRVVSNLENSPLSLSLSSRESFEKYLIRLGLLSSINEEDVIS